MQLCAVKPVQPGIAMRTSNSIAQVKREISDWLYPEVQGIVQTGPFEGMKIPAEKAWPDTYLPPLLLGCYEEELHGAIEKQITRLSKIKDRDPYVAVVGCAEGYYAVGFKRRLPNATVFAVDSNDACMAICERAAAANSVQLTVNAPVQTFMQSDLIFMDVEGAEVEYLDPVRLPFLIGSHVIVELHDYKELPSPKILLERFRSSHRINYLLPGPRNPAQYKWLCAMHYDYQWLAVSEGRPCLMGWFVMEPRGAYVT